jgi:hypothetical protein
MRGRGAVSTALLQRLSRLLLKPLRVVVARLQGEQWERHDVRNTCTHSLSCLPLFCLFTICSLVYCPLLWPRTHAHVHALTPHLHSTRATFPVDGVAANVIARVHALLDAAGVVASPDGTLDTRLDEAMCVLPALRQSAAIATVISQQLASLGCHDDNDIASLAPRLALAEAAGSAERLARERAELEAARSASAARAADADGAHARAEEAERVTALLRIEVERLEERNLVGVAHARDLEGQTLHMTQQLDALTLELKETTGMF